MSKEKLIPELRFPEFVKEGEWETKTLAEVAERIEEKVIDKKLITASISAGIGFVSQAEKFSRDISGAQYTNYIVLNKGDFSYNKGNSKKFPQGCVYKLKEFKQVAVPNAFISFRFRKNFVGDFYQGYFDNNFHGMQLKQFITSGARMDGLLNIKAIDFFSIVLPTPSKPEQQKIASCLSSLDEVIAAHSQKLELLKDHKKGLMQNLFPQEGEKVPKLRFKEFENDGEWVEKKLGEIAEIKRGAASNNLNYTDGNSKTAIRLLRINDFLSNQPVFVEDTDDMKRFRVKSGDILIAGTGATAGITFMVPDEFNDLAYSYNAPRIRVHNSNNYYAYHYLKSDLILNQQRKMFVGNAQPFLDTRAIGNFEILLPKNPNEQQKIASCLSSLDALITAQAEKIEQLKLHKKGLMQGLFPRLTD